MLTHAGPDRSHAAGDDTQIRWARDSVDMLDDHSDDGDDMQGADATGHADAADAFPSMGAWYESTAVDNVHYIGWHM